MDLHSVSRSPARSLAASRLMLGPPEISIAGLYTHTRADFIFGFTPRRLGNEIGPREPPAPAPLGAQASARCRPPGPLATGTGRRAPGTGRAFLLTRRARIVLAARRGAPVVARREAGEGRARMSH